MTLISDDMTHIGSVLLFNDEGHQHNIDLFTDSGDTMVEKAIFLARENFFIVNWMMFYNSISSIL